MTAAKDAAPKAAAQEETANKDTPAPIIISADSAGTGRPAPETAKRITKQIDKATDDEGKNLFTDDGLVIGLDAKNPVSNVNPDPLTVRGVYTL